jgi:hypothetical protein
MIGILAIIGVYVFVYNEYKRVKNKQINIKE